MENEDIFASAGGLPLFLESFVVSYLSGFGLILGYVVFQSILLKKSNKLALLLNDSFMTASSLENHCTCSLLCVLPRKPLFTFPILTLCLDRWIMSS